MIAQVAIYYGNYCDFKIFESCKEPFVTPPPIDSYTPREAADRLYDLCDELERRQVPNDQVEELDLL